MFQWFKNLFRRKKPKPIQTNPNLPQPVFIDGKLIDIELHDLLDFTLGEKAFFLKAMQLLLEVLSSQEFKDQFLGMPAAEKKGKSMSSVYELILSGQDKLEKHADGALDMLWALYGSSNKKSKTIGYTNMSKLKVFTHRYHYSKWQQDKYGAAILAGHVMHELMHNYGFIHRYIKKKSLVYKTGYLVKELGIKSMKGQKLTPC
jgi:hypothetical protein